MNECPICGKPYRKAKPTEFGGMEYFHEKTETSSVSCTQSSASYQAAQPHMHPTAAGGSTGENTSESGDG